MKSQFQNTYANLLHGKLKSLSSLPQSGVSIPALFSEKKKLLMELLKAGGGAQSQYQFDVMVDFGSQVFIPTIQTVSDLTPEISFNYSYEKGTVIPKINDFTNLTVSYWDFNTEEITNDLLKCYDAQFKNGLFDITQVAKNKIHFAFSTNMTATLSNCYMERPMRKGFQTAAGLASYSFAIAYMDISYQVEKRTPEMGKPIVPNPLNI